MAVRGATAKIAVQNKIQEAFGNDYITMQDNKIYVWADDGAERVQIAISMTCPKVPIDTAAVPDDGDTSDWDFTDPSPAPAQAQISVDEQQNIEDLMKRLGL